MAKNIKSVKLLPEILRTEKNQKFLSSTIDQLLQPAQLERVDGYIGSKLTPTYNNTSDVYIPESLNLRRDYNLEPALVVYNTGTEVQKVVAFDDLTNQIALQGGIVDNLDRLYRSEHYSFDPQIDIDKFVNYQQYYWLVNGPDTISVTGAPKNSTSTYQVTDNEINTAFVFSPDGLTSNPLVTLYRGNTYYFQINSINNLYIKTAPSLASADLYPATNNGTSTGTIKIVVDANTPATLYYASDDPAFYGKLVVKAADENTTIDIEKDVIGKKNYTSGNGVKFSNGMKIRFLGTVLPAEYQGKEFFVEGVGQSIQLIDFELLTGQTNIATQFNENFDANDFDDYPFDNFKKLPINPEYITINRGSRDLNPWTRYNRWVHSDIIFASAVANGNEAVYPANKRAQRPIIEFNANLHLYNFGNVAAPNVDLIDTDTTDAFSIVEGSGGYWVDGIKLQQGQRVIFNADLDPSVRGNIYEVNFLIINEKRRVQLLAVDTEFPAKKSSISVNLGDTYSGTSWWFNGSEWIYAQQHTTLNQPPLFDLFDNAGDSYSDRDYHLTSFAGNQIFGYEVGTGKPDSVLGFPLKYKNSVGVGSYLFKNYFATEEFIHVNSNDTTAQSITIPTSASYLKYSESTGDRFVNVWTVSQQYKIPVLQFQSTTVATSEIEINSINGPKKSNVSLDIYVNDIKLLQDDFSLTEKNGKLFVSFVNEVAVNSDVLFKLYTDKPANSNGYYEVPLGLTNNPLNGNIASLTLSEVSDHLNTMINRDSDWAGVFPGASNVRDLPAIDSYGTRLIANANPIAFASMFIGNVEHNAISAIQQASDDYNQFKFAFLRKASEYSNATDFITAVDVILKEINNDKNLTSPYFYSDMVAYGQDKNVRTWTVTDSRNIIYPITSDYNLNNLSLRSVLVYINGVQALYNLDYIFLETDSSIEFLVPLVKGDVITVVDYETTEGCYVPSTPSKLGLYPKFRPTLYVDDTFVSGPQSVIQCHDGSIMLAYGDYRDNIVLELEKRIYNNIKVEYKNNLFDYHSVIPGAFRKTGYSATEINQILETDFIKWAGIFGIDYQTNDSFDSEDPFTWNYAGTYSNLTTQTLFGSWRAIYKYFYDSEAPHLKPWEMLGFSDKPTWWEDEYGPAPYTSGNEILWDDIEAGVIRQGSRRGTNPLYARPGLSTCLPVDNQGNLVDPTRFIISNSGNADQRQSWTFGDVGPVEASWRRSSYWPFVVQRLLALTRPAEYCSLMFDTSRITKNIAGQWSYGDLNEFLNPQNLEIHSDNGILAAGYGVYIVESGVQKNRNYVSKLKNDLAYLNFNLFHKVGGFISKDKLRVVIDAISPQSTDPGSLLPPENYNLILNSSNPNGSISISGIVIQKVSGKFSVKGYNRYSPYFQISGISRNENTPTITVGGISEPYVTWNYSATNGATGLSAIDQVSASSAPTGNYYQQGQIVKYGNNFYRVAVSHRSEATFNPAYYSQLPYLPTVGGAVVQGVGRFTNDVINVPYGSFFNSIQEVYDFIVGYGNYLTVQGFVFDGFNAELNSVIDWDFTAKEFLYWTTQNWSDGSIITLSPFAESIKFISSTSVVDNMFNNYYEYNLLKADGTPLAKQNISVNRQETECIISAVNTTDGIYYANIRTVQKEHGMVFDNKTIFNDVIFDIETGYRQRRMRLVGFKTANWNGDYFSPGFVYDSAKVQTWTKFVDYKYGDVVRVTGNYYSAKFGIPGKKDFNVSDGWVILDGKPTSELIPNFDYKINQFEDFYSLDIDNFDSAQQKMAQHLIGYTPRVYLNNIIIDPISQYKFYQGFIKDKGTKNAVDKIAKATLQNKQGQIGFTEEWAFRTGFYGSYQTYKELEFPLVEGTFIENPQTIRIVDTKPVISNDLICYTTSSAIVIKPQDYSASSSFITKDETFADVEYELNTAGYVRLDDVDVTAYNEFSILDIANNRSINEGETFWIGFKSATDWDVVRYERAYARVIGVYINDPGVDMVITTDLPHNLTKDQLVSIIQFSDQIDGIYRVKEIIDYNKFSVSTEATFIQDTGLVNPGLLFKFNSKRFAKFDDIPSDSALLKMPYGSKLWVDDNGTGKWTVYQKTANYNSRKLSSSQSPSNQNLGWSISKLNDSNIAMVGATTYSRDSDLGRVFAYSVNGTEITPIFNYGVNTNDKTYYTGNGATELGFSVAYDDYEFNSTDYGLFISGAPAVSNTKGRTLSGSGGVRYSTGTEAASTLTQAGLVKISSIDTLLQTEVTELLLLDPTPANYNRFGSTLYVEKNQGVKTLLISAPGTSNTGTGHVYAYRLSSTSTSTNISAHPTGIEINSPVTLNVGSLWGQSISGSYDANTIAIGAPGWNTGTGFVSVFLNENFVTPSQVIYSPFDKTGQFGHSIKVSPYGDKLFVSAPYAKSDDLAYGKVAIYNKQSGQFVLTQIISNPVPGPGLNFGLAVDVTTATDTLVISAVGLDNTIPITFDGDATTFDAKATTFHSTLANTGRVYLYSRKDQKFVLGDKLSPDSNISGVEYGRTVVANDDAIYVGASAFSNVSTASAWYQFSEIDPNVEVWDNFRYQDNSVDIDQFQKISLYDSFNDKVLDYLDVIDPLKGKIAGLAEQEITYKSNFDPAVYSVGNNNTTVDTDTSWIEEHVGELWWDLSAVKFLWYEQGDLIYRKNNWGKIFPGATIDIYEWVKSEYLPSEWSVLADTPAGLTEGISGQPKYVDNSVVSVKQTFDSSTRSYRNFYYYWVKNSVLIPNVSNRRISSYQVASLIADPTSYGYKYAAFLDSDALSLSNVGNTLIGSRININIATDIVNNKIPRHTEWILIQEGDADSRPTTLLEKKLFDSLLGRDSLGNLVPDPSLSDRVKYGLGIRPQQTLFKNRSEALRNLIEFTNSKLIKEQLTGNYNLENFLAQESYPDKALNEWDELIEDNEGLLLIDTTLLEQAELTCTVSNGKIRGVTIVKTGKAYKVAPTVKIVGPNQTAVISTEIDAFGKVIKANIVDAGEGYSDSVPPELTVRPYTVIVLADNLYNGKWTVFAWNVDTAAWDRVRTQKYNVPLYWRYIDWTSDDYNKFIDYAYTVDELYQVNTLLDLVEGDYVRIKNSGDGLAIILEKTATGEVGTFDDDFNLVYKQNGTIQISDGVWNTVESRTAFDSNNSYDQTLFDQTVDLELEYMLKGLKKDIFINEFKINWNLFFFKAVKYALSEQKLIDWAFKTSFINVTNYAGDLDQRPVYKLQNTQYYEDFLKEVKPYHTQIRAFTVNHSVLEPTRSYTTDFDLPAYYNKDVEQFQPITLNSDLINTYPWKGWKDNYTYSVGSISVGSGGSGYVLAPDVKIVAVNGDDGFGATAKAYISSGAVSQIVVTNKGQGYKQAPLVVLTGGGDSSIVPAVVYAQLANEKVRVNKIGMKFDRISGYNQTGGNLVSDEFNCNGIQTDFVLNWLADPDKASVEVKLNGRYILKSDYTIKYYTETYNGYDKKYSKVSFLNYAPANYQTLSVKYKKAVSSLHAAERILSYYTATSGMPGLDMPQLMTGLEYPRTQLQTLKFDYTTKWDLETSTYGETSWADDVSDYVETTLGASSTATSKILTLTTTSGISLYQYVNVINTVTNAFAGNEVTVTAINTASRQITVSSPLVTNLSTGSVVEFWSYNSNFNILDTAIDGGYWSSGTNGPVLMDALGINPEDIIVDGDGFYTPNTSFGPEEFVPGESADAIGISVYTRPASGAPLVYSGYTNVYANQYTEAPLGIVPPSFNSLVVTFNGKIYEYYAEDVFPPGIDDEIYTVDWDNNLIRLGRQSSSGVLGWTIVTVGGEGVIDNSIVYSSYSTSTQVESRAAFTDIKDAFVTVNGNPITANTNTVGIAYYELTRAGPTNGRAAVNVYNLSQFSTSTVQAYFLNNVAKQYNYIREQLEAADGATAIALDTNSPVSSLGPLAPQYIVEVNEGSEFGVGYRRLLPPYTTYYNVSNPRNRTFAIEFRRPRVNPTYSIENVRVYVNGISIRPGFDYSVNDTTDEVTIANGILQAGDVVAILSKLTGEWDYDIIGTTLVLAAPVPIGRLIKIISFNDSDQMLIRTERFLGNVLKKFKISRQVLNTNYVWVSVNGMPLVNKIEYSVLSDGVTIQVSDSVPIDANDEIVIMSVSNQVNNAGIVGYRVFNDIFGRTAFKRLSTEDSTILSQPLSFTDTEIYVANSAVLTQPNPSKKIPGVILIDGERIEFYKTQGNVLKQLRRATLGTSPSQYCEAGTKVIDYGVNQTVPFTERKLVQNHITTSTTDTYVINTLTTVTNVLYGDGITLSSNLVGVSLADQVQVTYGGRLLRKTGIFYHDTTVAYDSPEFTLVGTTSTYSRLPFTSTNVVGDAYIVEDTNKVWVYTNSVNTDAVNGFVYRGLNWSGPEFSISSTTTHAVKLLIEQGVSDNVKLTITKKEFDSSDVWNDVVSSIETKSILDSTTAQAQFLQERHAELPDNYYYGGDNQIESENGTPLLTENDEPLLGP